MTTPRTKHPVTVRIDPTIPSAYAARETAQAAAMAAALEMAGGDDKRLVTAPDGSVVIVNHPGHRVPVPPPPPAADRAGTAAPARTRASRGRRRQGDTGAARNRRSQR